MVFVWLIVSRRSALVSYSGEGTADDAEG